MHYITFRAEGFEIHILLSQCLTKNIYLKNIRINSDNELIADIMGSDWLKLNKIAGNRYRLIIVKERGIKPFAIKLFQKRSTIAGIIIFIALIFVQASFISEIRVYGYEEITEREILEQLQEAGLFVGGSRNVDLDNVEIKMYRSLDKLSWIGITLKGGLAEVTIAEGTDPIVPVDVNTPCHIVAGKEGYIEKIIAREGKEVVAKDDFVNVGDVLISGIIGVEDKTYSREPESLIYNYVHADGEVYANTIHRYIFYQEPYRIEKRKTGKVLYGIRIKIGTFTWSSSDLYLPYETSYCKEKTAFKIVWPLPLELKINEVYELELYRWERDEEEIVQYTNRQIREIIKDDLSESVQITNKSLKFLPEENIIKVIVLLEVLEQIGQKSTFIPTETGDPAE